MPPSRERAASLASGSANEAMNAYADGDASAFPVLYDAIAPRLEAFVKRRTADPSRIDDVVQQTFERIHRARGTFIRGSDVLSWAFKIAHNLCIDMGTQGWRERPADDRDGAGPLADAVAEVVDAERIATARETLAKAVQVFRTLPKQQQLALELVRVEGFSMNTAAENLGITLPALRMSLFRGAAALRDAVLEHEPKDAHKSATVQEEQLHGLS